MLRITTRVAVIATLALSLLGRTSRADDGPHIVYTPAYEVVAELTSSLTFPNWLISDWIWYAPRPPELLSQHITSATITCRNGAVGHEAPELSLLQRPVLALRVQNDPAMQHLCEVTAKYSAVLYDRRLVLHGERQPVPHLNWRELVTYLSFSYICDWNSRAFQQWIGNNGMRRRRGETPIDFAKRVEDHMMIEYDYAYIADQDRRLSNLCTVNRTDCGGLCNVFVGILRANGIPARVMPGRWVTELKPGDDPQQTHVKAEFFDSGAGWIPVEVCGAVQYKNDPAHDRSKDFGSDRGKFLVFNTDGRVVLDTYHWGIVEDFWFQNIDHWGFGWSATPNDRTWYSSQTWTTICLKQIPRN